ncbi:MAG: hypothetical protein M1816_000030 [Peltula sp. TS41687]|nr:MAG: hypothetical protein M1816_000030 [Peltula sp. TS41687]
MRHKYDQAIRRKQLWDRATTQTSWQGWLSSSWGGKGSGGRWVDTDRLASQQGKEGEGTAGSCVPESPRTLGPNEPGGSSSRHTGIDTQLQELKRRLDEDAFGTLFGPSLGRLDRSGPWAPHMIGKMLVWEDPQGSAKVTESAESRGVCFRDDTLYKSSQTPKTTASNLKSATPSEFDIDPITMRKVHRTTLLSQSDQGTTVTPVKTFPGREPERSQSKTASNLKSKPEPPIAVSKPLSNISSLSRPQSKGDSKGNLEATSGLSDSSYVSSVPHKKEDLAPDTRENQEGRRTPSSIWLVDEGFGGSTKDRKIVSDASLMSPRIVSTFEAKPSSMTKPVILRVNGEEELDSLRPADVRASIIKGARRGADTEVAGREVVSEDRFQKGVVSKENSSEKVISPVPALDARDSASASAQPQLTYTRFPENDKTQSRKQSDKQLVMEIRGIYEDDYGVIDTKHRQKSIASPLGEKLTSSRTGTQDEAYSGMKLLQSEASDLSAEQKVVLSKPIADHYDIIKPKHRQKSFPPTGNRLLRENEASSQARREDKVYPGLKLVQTEELSPEQKAVFSKASAHTKTTLQEMNPVSTGLFAYEQQLKPIANQSEAGPGLSKADAVEPTIPAHHKVISTKTEHLRLQLARRCEDTERIPQDAAKEGNSALQKIKRKLDNLLKEQEMAQVDPVESITSKEPLSSTSVPPAVYKVLAFDPARDEVVSAGTTSSMGANSTNEQILTPAEVIPRLHSPARFLAYFSLLQGEGYEIVSGGGDVLVFKKVREPIETPSRPGDQAEHTPVPRSPYGPFTNPIDGTTTTGNFASPTGFVNYDSFLPPQASEVDAEEVEATGTSSNINRAPEIDHGEAKLTAEGEETATDHDAQQQQHKSTLSEESMGRRIKKAAKNMVWAGFLVGGWFYLVGVLVESW